MLNSKSHFDFKAIATSIFICLPSVSPSKGRNLIHSQSINFEGRSVSPLGGGLRGRIFYFAANFLSDSDLNIHLSSLCVSLQREKFNPFTKYKFRRQISFPLGRGIKGEDFLFRFEFIKRQRFRNLNVALFLKQMKRTEIRVPRGSTLVITEVVEISEVKRCDKNTALVPKAFGIWLYAP